MTDEVPGQERRRYSRTDSVSTVIYDLLFSPPVSINALSQSYPAVAVDVSEGGIGLIVSQLLPTDMPVQLRFELLNTVTTNEIFRQRSFKLDARIRHCVPRNRQYFRVGAEFANISPEDREFIATFIKDLSLPHSGAT